MAAFDYVTTAREARDSLKEAGAIVDLIWTPAPVSDAPDAATPAEVTHRAYGAVLPYNFREVGAQPDSLIKAGDQNLLLAALDLQGRPLPEPPFDAVVVLVDGSRHRVKAGKPLAPAGVPVLFDITIRR